MIYCRGRGQLKKCVIPFDAKQPFSFWIYTFSTVELAYSISINSSFWAKQLIYTIIECTL